MADDNATSTSELRRPTSRSRRSQPSFADLRLHPLSPAFQTSHLGAPEHDENGPLKRDTSHASYILGRSGPSRPAMLSPVMKRRHGGLSRKNSLYDLADALPAEDGDTYFSQAAAAHSDSQDIGYDANEVPRRNTRSDASPAARGLDNRLLPRAKTNAYSSDRRVTQSGHSTPRPRTREGSAVTSPAENWLTHAGAYTSFMLAESKGQSWTNTYASSSNLFTRDEYDEARDAREAAARVRARIKPVSRTENVDGPSSQLGSPWGSRFGSRAPSARNSRRGSRVLLPLTPGLMTLTRPSPDKATSYIGGPRDSHDVFPPPSSTNNLENIVAPHSIKPEFLNLSDERDILAAESFLEADYDEQEVAQLAQQNSLGLGTLIDRLLGLQNDVHEDHPLAEAASEDSASKEFQDDNSQKADTRRNVQSAAAAKALLENSSAVEDVAADRKQSVWADTKFLLGLASSVLY